MKLITIAALTVTTLALGIEIPDGDPLASLLALVTSWGAMSPLAIGAAIIVVVVQALKKFAPGLKYKPLIVAVLGTVYAVLLSVQSGIGLGHALVAALLVSGGAMAIYDAIKPLLPKP